MIKKNNNYPKQSGSNKSSLIKRQASAPSLHSSCGQNKSSNARLLSLLIDRQKLRGQDSQEKKLIARKSQSAWPGKYPPSFINKKKDNKAPNIIQIQQVTRKGKSFQLTSPSNKENKKFINWIPSVEGSPFSLDLKPSSQIQHQQYRQSLLQLSRNYSGSHRNLLARTAQPFSNQKEFAQTLYQKENFNSSNFSTQLMSQRNTRRSLGNLSTQKQLQKQFGDVFKIEQNPSIFASIGLDEEFKNQEHPAQKQRVSQTARLPVRKNTDSLFTNSRISKKVTQVLEDKLNQGPGQASVQRQTTGIKIRGTLSNRNGRGLEFEGQQTPRIASEVKRYSIDYSTFGFIDKVIDNPELWTKYVKVNLKSSDEQ